MHFRGRENAPLSCHKELTNRPGNGAKAKTGNDEGTQMDSLTAKIERLDDQRAMWTRLIKQADSKREASYYQAEIKEIDRLIKETEQEWQALNAWRDYEGGENEAAEQIEFPEYTDY